MNNAVNSYGVIDYLFQFNARKLLVETRRGELGDPNVVCTSNRLPIDALLYTEYLPEEVGVGVRVLVRSAISMVLRTGRG